MESQSSVTLAFVVSLDSHVISLQYPLCLLQDRKQQLLPLASQLLGSSPHDTRLQHLLMQKQLLQQTAPLSLPFGRQIEPSWLAAFKAAETSVNILLAASMILL